jgi:metallo-beta-lactamase family protein
MKKRKSGFRARWSAYHDKVTGSHIFVRIERPDDTVQGILVDCGYFQEQEYVHLNYVTEIKPESVDAMVVTHNHIDHTGLIPKFVKDGYNKNIYMTNITKELAPDFWKNLCSLQKRDTKRLREKYPESRDIFRSLYSGEDIKKTKKLLVGINYYKTIEILPGTKLTFMRNAHLLGAAMVLLQCSCDGFENINLLFTGDYRLKSCFDEVPEIPEWLKNMPLIMIHEATNGNIKSTEIKKNFRDNMIQAFLERKDIIIGAFAQGRYQEQLYDFKIMQEEDLIPKEYNIYVDGTLGIKTTRKYQKILARYNPEKADFLPKGTKFVTKKTRGEVFADVNPKIIITTSGMLSDGPARLYIPFFIQRKNAVIQIIGYAAEGTIARALYDGKNEETITIRGQQLIKRAKVRTTREKSGHAFCDEMINFLKQFNNIQFLGINHGSTEAQEALKKLVEKETDIDQIGFLNRKNMYIFYQNTPKGAEYYDMQIKSVPARLDAYVKNPREVKSQQEKRKQRQVEKAAQKRRRNNERRKRKAKMER